MNEIIYRAWDKRRGKMIENVNIDQGKAVEFGYQWFNQPCENLNDLIPLKFIGKLDKNKRKIFDCDIVNISDNTGEYFPIKEDGGENFVIKWWDEMCGYWLWHIESKSWWSGELNPFSYLEDNEIEIIGNKFENPELLENK